MSAADILWPRLAVPADVEVVEQIPLGERGVPTTTFGVLSRAAALWPDSVAVKVMPDASRWSEAVELTYSELCDQAGQVANLLQGLGVRRGTPVGVMSPNCAQLLATMFGVQAAGVAVPLNGGLSVEHLSTLIDRTGTLVLVVAGPELDGAIWQKALELAESADLSALLVLEPTVPDERPALPDLLDRTVVYLADAVAGVSTEFVDQHTGQDLAAVFHTGGTTGIPKLAAHTHANQTTNAWMIAADSTLGEDRGAVLAALPLFHVNALHVTMLAPMLKGQPVVWAGPLGFRDPALYAEIWRIIEHFGIATMSAVPTVYAVLAACPVNADISSLQFAVVGAAALPAAVRKAFEQHTGVPLLEGYGLTEATCASARSFLADPRPGSAGQRMPYQPMRVVDVAADGSWYDVPPGQVGTLLVAGPAVFAGYVTGRKDGRFVVDALGKVRDGWLDTGDLARIDEDGFLYLTGRAKDIIIRGGHNIDPSSIEAVLLEHPDVSAAAAVGQPDPRAGELPIAYVVLRSGAEHRTTATDLRAWIAGSSLEAAAKPKSVHIIGGLPLTAVGKPFKLPLRAAAAEAAITQALASLSGVHEVRGEVVDGAVRVVVSVRKLVDREAVDAVLSSYTVDCAVVDCDERPSR